MDDCSPRRIIAVDFETYYDKECSISTLGPLGYFSHPDFDAYLVSMVSNDGVSYCGHPKDADWSLLDDAIVLSHNASFDETLYLFGVEQGWWPSCSPFAWHCTADMAAYCGLPRNLKGAAAAALGEEISKSTRNSMMGKRPESMTPEFMDEVVLYALKDSQLCLDLWDAISEKWPAHEREISRVNRRALQRGLPIDQQGLAEALGTLNLKLFEAESAIPWFGLAPTLSRKKFDEQCRQEHLEPPKSLAMGDPDAEKWMEEHSPKHRWISAVRDFRRINALKRKLESFDYATVSDGRYYGSVMYFGASATGRFSGSGGNLNLQNLPRGEMFGVDVRKLITAKPGRKLVVVDLSQIEVRTLCWLAGDYEMLKLIEQSDDIYEAFAIKYGVWDPSRGALREADSKLRSSLVKPVTLGCGYQASPTRLSESTGMPMDVAEEAVQMYRSTMRPVVDYWTKMQNALVNAFISRKSLRLRLPSGRILDYGPIQFRKKIISVAEPDPEDPRKSVLTTKVQREYTCITVQQSRRVVKKLYGGLLTENLSQALARDIFADALVRIDRAGHELLLHVHDEAVVEVDEDKAEETLADIVSIMSTPPEWIPDIPLASEGKIMQAYSK